MEIPNPAFKAWFLSNGAYRHLPESLRKVARELTECEGDASAPTAVVSLASEVLSSETKRWPVRLRGPQTQYLILLDVSAKLVMQLPTILEVHKPDQRLHVSPDIGAIRRFVIAQFRDVPAEGIVDAGVFNGTLFLLLGDLSRHAFPVARIERLAVLSTQELNTFEINKDGSFISWPDRDLDFGVRQLLKQIDPMFLAKLEIERNSHDFSGKAIRLIREERNLNQSDIRGMSERQVRRIEKGESSLTLEAVQTFSEAFGLTLSEFLDQLAVKTGQIKKRTQESVKAS